MKNYFYLLLIAVVLISACGKDKNEIQPNPNPGEVQTGETNKVKFNISSYDIADFPSTKIGQHYDYNEIRGYGLYIYDSFGQLFTSKEAGFIVGDRNLWDTLISHDIELPNGYYDVVFIGFNDTSTYYSSGSSSLSSAWAYTIDSTKDWNVYYNDYFYKRIQIESRIDTAIAFIVPRTTGRLEIQFNDTIYPNSWDTAPYVEMSLENFPYGIKFKDGSPHDPMGRNVFYFTKAEWSNFTYGPLVINCMPTQNPKITLNFMDESGYIYHTKVIENFPIHQNKITRLRGNLFDNTKNFSISIDTDWGGIIEGEFK